MSINSSLLIAILAQIVGIIVVILVIKKYAYPIILKTIEQREAFIKKSLKNAEDANLLKENMDLELSKQKQSIIVEKNKIITDAKMIAQNEAQTIVSDAKTRSRKILEKSSLDAVLEKKLMQDDFNENALELVAMVSSKFLNKKIDDETELKLILDAVSKVKDV